jgi:glutamate N-acetyltransferase / amino-acid N-acetyltransferase
MEKTSGGITAPKGYKAAGLACGIKKSGKKDLALILSDVPANAAAMFTTNKVKAAPVILSMDHIKGGRAQAIIANAGCANACTGAEGLEDARMMVRSVASLFNIPVKTVLVASTGTIGSRLPMKKIMEGVRSLQKKLSVSGGRDAAEAILTTDLSKKEIAVKLKAGGKTITIAGIAKGSGMIAPNMATMFAFITTDAFVSSGKLKKYLFEAVDNSFNMTVVDKDTSTNDCVFALANGMAGNRAFNSKEEKEFKRALEFVCAYLAKEIARDGEGATKLMEVKVEGAKTRDEARSVAHSVAGSDLVKSAMFGEDPNFGRILAAVGYSGADVRPDLINVFIGETQVAKNGCAIPFNVNVARKHLKGKEISVNIMLGQGTHMATAWGCDLTYDYVKINAEYHT